MVYKDNIKTRLYYSRSNSKSNNKNNNKGSNISNSKYSPKRFPIYTRNPFPQPIPITYSRNPFL